MANVQRLKRFEIDDSMIIRQTGTLGAWQVRRFSARDKRRLPHRRSAILEFARTVFELWPARFRKWSMTRTMALATSRNRS